MGDRGGGRSRHSAPRRAHVCCVPGRERGERLGPVREGETCRTRRRRGVRGPLGGPWLPPGGKRLQQKGDVISERDTRHQTALNTLPLCDAPENYHMLRNVNTRISRHLSRCPRSHTCPRCSFLDARPVGGPPSPECPVPMGALQRGRGEEPPQNSHERTWAVYQAA